MQMFSPPTTAMSWATCRPTHHFLKGPVGVPSAGFTAHLPSTQVPAGQSEVVVQLGAVSQVPSMQSSPDLHSVELPQLPPQSTVPPAALPLSQPGKSGGQISFTGQRAGASASSKLGGSC